MAVQTPLADLIKVRLLALGLDRQALGFRLGYQNPLKAAGRVHALCDGHITSTNSRRALQRLPAALELPPEVVEAAVAATEALFAELERQAEEACRLAREQKEAEWRASFEPHAVIQTERTVPSQITICGLTGGAGPRLIIPFDLFKPPISYIDQAVSALPKMLPRASDGRRYVIFFGEALGLIINYSPDRALRCDLEGKPLEVLDKAYRLGEVRLSIGGRPVSPRVIARVLNVI